MQSTSGNALYLLDDVPGKGKGLVAIEKIPKATRILSEEPIITVPEYINPADAQKSIFQQVEALSEQQRRGFLSMHNIHPYKTTAEQYLGIFRTNGLPIERIEDEGAIFLNACRINHACDNNAQKSWNKNIKRHTVHALRDIDKGEEITIYYLGTERNREYRRNALQEKFGFVCSCRLCSLPEEQSRESDKRLDEILRLDGVMNRAIMDGLIMTSPLRALRYVDQQIRLYNEQGPGDVGLGRAFFDAAQVAITNGDLARGRVLLERALSAWRTSGGDDSTNVIQFGKLVEDPSKYQTYGYSKKWTTAVDEVPSGLEPSVFENWLWKREQPRKPGQPADLRSRTSFPAFEDLPRKSNFDEDFYTVGTNKPRRHWCFLSEIVDSFTLVRMTIELKDVDGKDLPLVFYTDGQGRELAPADIQKGYTVAILYAEYRAFKFDKPGIRHEDPRTIKIFPMSLDELMTLNDQIQQFSTEIDGIRTCHGCGRKAASLQRCAKCSSFWYCGRACQQAGWNTKGHKGTCKLLKNPDLRGLFLLDWDKFDDYVRFPLRVAENSGI